MGPLPPPQLPPVYSCIHSVFNRTVYVQVQPSAWRRVHFPVHKSQTTNLKSRPSTDPAFPLL